MAKIRVLVVDDSLTVRKRLVEILASDPDIDVVGEAADGKRAIELCLALRPDVMTLDMVLPVMSGLAVTEYVMAHCALPIVIVSASLNRGDVFKTLDALAAGAIDVLEKPRGDGYDEAWERNFISTIKIVSRIRVISHPRAKLRGFAPGVLAQPTQPTPPRRPPATQASPIVAIGTSTGGPAALMEIFRALPSDFPLPILVVVHIGAAFAGTFAEWLGGQSALPIAFARDQQELPPFGRPGVLLAPADRHLVVRNGRLCLTDAPERHSCRPSVDELFESIAQELGPHAIACLMTGMGKDGAAGLLAIRKAGGRTFAQDAATSVIFGMNGEAIALGAAEVVLPLAQIAPTLEGMARAVAEQRRRP